MDGWDEIDVFVYIRKFIFTEDAYITQGQLHTLITIQPQPIMPPPSKTKNETVFNQLRQYLRNRKLEGDKEWDLDRMQAGLKPEWAPKLNMIRIFIVITITKNKAIKNVLLELQ